MLGVPGEAQEEKEDTSWKREPEARQDQSSNSIDNSITRHGKLCRLLVNASAVAMRDVFNTIHPPINLHTRLTRIQSLRTLQRLRQNAVLSSEQWDALYPKDKNPSTENFDSILLHILLKHVCHLSPPYPNGWEGPPLVNDTSLSAYIVRLDHLRHLIVNKDIMDEGDYYYYFEQIAEILCNLSTPTMRAVPETISNQDITNEQRKEYVEYVERWERIMESTSKNTSIESLDSARSQLSSGIKLPKIETSHVNDDHGLTSSRYGAGSSTPARKTSSASLAVPGSQQDRSPSATSRRNSLKNIGPENAFLAQDKNILSEHYKQLVDNVRSDAVLPKLVKLGILSHEEKNNINLATRNIDRMKALLRLIPTKQRAAFPAFCEAIKFKYIAIYDTLMKAKLIAMERPDDVTEANTNLRSSYKSTMSKLTPVPWHPNATIDIRDFYTPLYITDIPGRAYSPDTLFKLMSQPQRHKGRRVMLEGESGSGKSTVCRYITTEWAHRAVSIADKFRLVYYIEVKLLKKSLAETILEHNYEPGYKKTPEEVIELIGDFQKDVMFVLDGLEDLAPKVADEVMDLLSGVLFPQSSVLVTMNSTHVTPSLLKMFDTRLAVLGLSPYTQEEFVLRYAKLTKTKEDNYTDVFEKVVNTETNERRQLQVLAQNPQLLMCMCLLSETGTPLKAETTTSLLQAFFLSLQKLYCSKNNIKLVKGEMPEKLQIMAQDMEENAWRCMHQNGSFYVYDQSDTEASNSMFALGILRCRASSSLPGLQQLFFTNRIFQDFMVARVLCRLEPEDFEEYVDTLVNDRYYSNVTQYFCGLLKDDLATERLDSVIQGLAQTNATFVRGNTPDVGHSHTTTAITEGCLGDFVLSLACLNECEGRADMVKTILDSLPVRFVSKHQKLITNGAVMGFNHVLRHPAAMIAEVEIRLDHFSRYYSKTLTLYGTAISHSKTIRQLRLLWSDSDLLAEVLAIIFQSQCPVRTIWCFNKSTKPIEHRVSASVWSNMKRASHNMNSVQDFHFINCQNKAMVACVLHSLPYSIQHLTVSNAIIDMVSAKALAKRVENTRSLKILDLTMVKICRPDFSYICSGLRLCGTLVQLNLTDTNIDTTSFVALAEALQFNRSIKILDIGLTKISDLACSALALSLHTCPTISKVIVEGTKMTEAGKQMLNSQTNDINFPGIETVRILPSQNGQFTRGSGQINLPLL